MNKLTLYQPQLTTATRDDQVIQMWLSQKAESTAKIYLYTLNQFLAFTENVPLSKLTYDDLIAWVGTLEGLAANTQRNKIAVIKSLFSFAEKLGYTTFNVTKIIKPPKAQDSLTERILSQDEVKAIINQPTSYRDKILLKTIYLLGLRVSEIVNLKWSDLFIRDGKPILKVNGKGKKIRYLIIPDKLYNELLRLKKPDNDIIFISRKKQGKLGRETVFCIIQKAGKEALDKKVSPHFLRHSHATHSLANGCDLKLLSNNLGHGNIAITSRYIHANQDDCSSNYLNL